MARVLITGAGMVGCHAARALGEAGHAPALFDAAPRTDYVIRVAGGSIPVYRGDILEIPVLASAVRDHGAELIVHTAALIGGAAQAIPYRGFQVNVVGTINVAEIARLLGVRRVVHASTLGTNDLSQPQLGPIDERFPLGSGGRVYGASKVAAEQVLRASAGAHGLELAMLRFAGVYGLGHFAGGSGIGSEIDGWIRAALAGQPGRSTGGMPSPYEIVHVKDVAAAVVAACTVVELPFDTYNVGSGELVTPEDVVAGIARIVPGFRLAGEIETRPDRFPRRFPFDLGRAREILGWEPRLDLDAGLADLVAEIRAVD